MPRILLIDDDEILVKTLKTILEHAGHKVVPALGGEEGLRLAKAEPPDLVILDVMMPGTDGLEVCRALRQDDRLCDVPVLVFTALGEHDLRAHAGLRKRGNDVAVEDAVRADDFITKPVTVDELLRHVNTLLWISDVR